ncbi:MAG: M48 family metalloprotease [Bacteroidota bacterium]
MKQLKSATYVLILLLAISIPHSLISQERDPVTEGKIEDQLKAIDPTLVPTFKAATIAFDKSDYAAADSLYTIVYQKAPTFDPAIRRLGSCKIQMGDLQNGINLCEEAIRINKSSSNVITLASMLISIKETDQQRANDNYIRAIKLLKEGRELPGADDYEYTTLLAQASMQSYQVDAFKKATAELLQRHPDKWTAHYFAAVMAAEEENWILSENEIVKAKELGMAQEDVDSFLDSGIHTKALTEKAKTFFLWTLLIWALGFVLLYIVGLILSNYTLNAIEREFKTQSSTKLAHTLRSVYGFLINTAGIYYYISLPIILILVIALVVGIFYLFLMLGRIPIQLMLVLLIGACITVYGMIRSLILKVKHEDPGRKLEEKDAPALFALTKEVAQTMGTRPIDEIRITPETDLAVYELGSWREKLRDNGKRILILGTGVLKDFKVDDFKAVLAHEYGHFSNRDTAGGAVALRVRNDMHKYYIALFYAGQAVWWNLAFQFIRLYDFIFRKISNGATLLQEILADRVAAQTYGAEAFENGLTYVIKRNIEFVKLANSEIEVAQLAKRSFNNLYELNGGNITDIEEEVKKSLNRETTDEDTHPSPVDRFRFIKGLGNGKALNSSLYVRDLFTDWNALTIEMTKNIEDRFEKPTE